VVGRGRELREAGRLLDRAAGGAGGLLTFVGASGSGKTALAEAAADEARRRGFEVLRGSPPSGQPGRLIWAQLLRDAGGPDELAAALLRAEAGPLDLDSAARHLASAVPRLIVVDDLDRGGLEAAAMLSVVAARCAPSCTAVIATSATPLGLPGELRLAGLSQADLTEAVLVGTTGEPAAQAVGEAGARRALWVASRGLPGVALSLARELAGLAAIEDAVVHLALRAAPTAAFLDVDANLIRLLELAAERATDDAARARSWPGWPASCSATPRPPRGGGRWLTRRSGWPGGPGTRARWPRSSTPGCARCGTRPERRPGWRSGPRSSTWPGRQGTTGVNVTASSGGSWR
jgi:AAA ATPase domain